MTRKLNVIIVMLVISILISPLGANAFVKEDEKLVFDPDAVVFSKLWDFTTGGFIVSSPAVVDLDKDGTC